MSKYILITVNERKIFEPNYFETFNEAQKEEESILKMQSNTQSILLLVIFNRII